MDKSKFLSLISNLSNLAKKDNWQTSYDEGLDSFYWTKPIISKEAKLKQFLDDFSLYITPTGLIEGLFIEYAKYNFNAHNEGYEQLFNAMTVKIDSAGQIYTVPKERQDEIGHLLDNMASKVAQETLQVMASGVAIESIINQ